MRLIDFEFEFLERLRVKTIRRIVSDFIHKELSAAPTVNFGFNRFVLMLILAFEFN